jgi:hypothetical protein
MGDRVRRIYKRDRVLGSEDLCAAWLVGEHAFAEDRG